MCLLKLFCCSITDMHAWAWSSAWAISEGQCPGPQKLSSHTCTAFSYTLRFDSKRAAIKRRQKAIGILPQKF